MTQILNAHSEDITQDVIDAADLVGIPRQLVLGCAIAESNLNPRAERWGRSTADAQAAITTEAWPGLQAIIDVAWKDVSFGYMQQIVAYHYLGDRTQSYQNCLAVRAQVFANPRGNLINGAVRLASNLKSAHGQDLGPVGDDALLGACVIYNVGHWPQDAAEWAKVASHVQRYRESLAQAATLLVESSGEVTLEISREEPIMTIEERAAQLGPERLGNGGQPETGVYTIHAAEGDLRFQMYWHGGLLEYTKPDGSTDVLTLAEATLPAGVAAAFRS